jgi:alpha-ribazole phosphatase
METRMTIYAARHAEVALSGVCYGQIDVPTRVTSDDAAATLLAQIARDALRIDRVVCSPWARAREPAERVAAALGVPVASDARLSELAFGEWEGARYADLEANDPRFASWMSAYSVAAPPGGERLEDLLARVRAAFDELTTPEDAVLVVAHSGSIRALRAIARGEPYAFDPAPHLVIERIEHPRTMNG